MVIVSAAPLSSTTSDVPSIWCLMSSIRPRGDDASLNEHPFYFLVYLVSCRLLGFPQSREPCVSVRHLNLSPVIAYGTLANAQ